ncbi:MAG: efflux RND transporter permease subunit [Blastomonas sp.]|uniref:efflux RND transporter permease subunit n=1 Tax=Blastomonas sp. TaxID=1909299 RepID=UPI00258EB4BB|nr:efflux RND transporter permease subunit [Blastomonas sp.]MCO5791672.1 efflux RND transporter permease subunit [Blastomonas sp.]
MNLAAFTISRWQLSLVAFMLLAALGLTSLFTIPRSVDPHFPIPVVTVIIALPGADAADIEQTIAKPVEEVLRGIDDIDEIRTGITDGFVTITTEFDWNGDPDQYFNDVVREVSAIRSQLPEGITELRYRKARTTEAAVLQLAMVSETASWRRMQKYAEDIRDTFVRYPGVRNTVIDGLPQPEVQVSIDSRRLAELGLAPSAIADALRRGGAELPPGAVESAGRRFNVEAGGAYRDLETIRNLPIRAGNGTLLRIADVATVDWGNAEQLYITRFNGKRAIFLSIQQKDGYDVIRLRDSLDAELKRQQAGFPPDIRLEQIFDQSRDIEYRLRELTRDFSIALFLVIFTLLPLGWRASVIVMISIPLSLASGLLAISVMGFNLSQLAVAGFIVALGLLVDDSIVVTENISRHLRMGKRRSIAAIDATREITPAVLGSTGVLIFAFTPLLFLPEGAGKFTQSFIYTIIFTVFASLVISLTIIPFLASRILSRDEDPEGNAILRWLTHQIERLYRPILHRALDKPRQTLWASMALTLSAFALIPVLGFSLFPYADTAYFRVTVDAEQGSGVATTDALVKKAEAVLAREDAIKVRATNVGSSNPQVFYNVFALDQRPNFGEVFAVMDRWDPKQSPQMVQRIRERLEAIPGARFNVELFQNGAPIASPVALRLTGENLETLRSLAAKIETILRATPGARDVINPVATNGIDLDVGLDEAKAAMLNIAPGEARRAVRLALSGENAAAFRDEEGDSYRVVVRLPLSGSQPISALDQIYVASRTGEAIALSQISTPRLESVPPQIQRYQLERSVTITANAQPGALPSRISQQAMDKVAELKLPPGYRVSAGGEAEAIATVFGGLGPIILIALFGIFAVLVAEFGRFRETIVVAGVIPLGTFGGFVALFVTGASLSYMAIIGFVALVGIEIKNSILLVDFTTQLRREGMGLRAAIERAGEVRFLPVLLTSVTAIGGLLPLAIFGGSLYAPLASVIIGGLISSTLLSRIVTPVMYLLIARGGEQDDDPKSAAIAPVAG